LFLSRKLFLCLWFLHPRSKQVSFVTHKLQNDPLYQCLHHTREKVLLDQLINAVEKQAGDAFDQAIAQYDPNDDALDDTSHRALDSMSYRLLANIKADKIRAVAAAQNAQEQVSRPESTLRRFEPAGCPPEWGIPFLWWRETLRPLTGVALQRRFPRVCGGGQIAVATARRGAPRSRQKEVRTMRRQEEFLCASEVRRSWTQPPVATMGFPSSVCLFFSLFLRAKPRKWANYPNRLGLLSFEQIMLFSQYHARASTCNFQLLQTDKHASARRLIASASEEIQTIYSHGDGSDSTQLRVKMRVPAVSVRACNFPLPS
jgi:hypothetical protein